MSGYIDCWHGPVRQSAAELLRDLGRALGKAHVRWYVFGAQAVIVHGLPRHTMDVDVTVLAEPGDVPRLIELMGRAGFELRVREDVARFVAETRVLPFAHARTGLPLDLVLGGPGPEEEFASRARTIRSGGVSFPVISAEDLIVLKVLAGRPKDLEDVRGVIERQGTKLHLSTVRERIRELEQALDRSDLVPEFEQLLRASRAPKTRKPVRRRRS